MENLFVYGTLCFPEIIETLTGKSFSPTSAVLKGYRRFKVKGGDYPAIVIDDRSEVEGLLIENVDKNSLEIISFYESEDYRIEKLMVNCNGKIKTANVFVWDADATELEDADWDLNEFLDSSLKIYVEKVIPDTILEFNQNR